MNRVLKERPKNPLEVIAKSLKDASGLQYPTFEKFNARRTFLNDDLSMPTLRVDVYLSHKGRCIMAHRHIFAYDEEERDQWLWDYPEEKMGLNKACALINGELSENCRTMIGNEALTIQSVQSIDSCLV